MATQYHVKAEVTFLPTIVSFFNLNHLHLVKEFRSSFWLENVIGSVFSATTLSHSISLNEQQEAELVIANYGSVENKLAVGIRFYLGVYPTAMCQGVITAMLE